MSFITLIIGGLAVWRLSHALVKENGPLMVFARLRARLAARQKRSGGLFDLISCVYCVSVWIGLIAALWPSHDLSHWIGYGLAFSGIAMLLEVFFANKSNPFSVVAPPTSDNKVSVGARSSSE
jgi:hypothetical protein